MQDTKPYCNWKSVLHFKQPTYFKFSHSDLNRNINNCKQTIWQRYWDESTENGAPPTSSNAMNIEVVLARLSFRLSQKTTSYSLKWGAFIREYSLCY